MSAAYPFGFLDEYAKKEVRRSALKAVALPGYQVPYSSREMPMGRGFGTGGLQLTLSLLGKGETLKVIDQGSDDSVNAVNLHSVTSPHSGKGVAGRSTHRAAGALSRPIDRRRAL